MLERFLADVFVLYFGSALFPELNAGKASRGEGSLSVGKEQDWRTRLCNECKLFTAAAADTGDGIEGWVYGCIGMPFVLVRGERMSVVQARSCGQGSSITLWVGSHNGRQGEQTPRVCLEARGRVEAEWRQGGGRVEGRQR